MKYFLPGILILILVIIIGAGAFYLGKQTVKPQDITPTPTVFEKANTNAQATPTITKTPVQTKTVAAGGVLSFPAYTLNIPLDWTSQREQGQDSDKLTLTKGGYKITISEAAFGGGGCLYPGDPPSEFAQTYSKFVQISNPNGFVFRRGSSSDTDTGWTVCQKSSEGSFGAPTIFGHINITTPVNPSDEIMAEIDSIFASIKK